MLDQKEKKSIFDVDALRSQALQFVFQGPVDFNYPLNTVDACELLNNVLASEILCVLRYRHHQLYAEKLNCPFIAAEFSHHAESEEVHVLLIADRINQLGGVPNFNPSSISDRSATEFGYAQTLLAMIQEDLIAERIATETYRGLIKWFGVKDPTTRRMLERILADEEGHAQHMAALTYQQDIFGRSLNS